MNSKMYQKLFSIQNLSENTAWELYLE